MEMESDKNTTSDSWCEDGTSSEDSNSSNDEAIDWQNEELHPHRCVESKRDFKRMEKKLQGDPYSLNRAQESENQDQPIHVAIYCEHINCVKYLLDEGASVDLENYEGKTPLERAINKRCEVNDSFQRVIKLNIIIKSLLKHGADVDYKGYEFPCTHFISQLLNCEDMEMFKLFLDYGAKTEDIQAIEKGEMLYESLIYETLVNCNFKVAKLLFLHGAIINIHKLPNSEFYCMNHIPILHTLVKHITDTNEDDYCKVLNLYRQFGGNCRLKYRGKTAMRYMRKIGHAEKHIRFYSLLQYHVTNPLCLQSICRLTIRSCIGREYKANIAQLPLPNEVKQFLKFKYD